MQWGWAAIRDAGSGIGHSSPPGAIWTSHSSLYRGENSTCSVQSRWNVSVLLLDNLPTAVLMLFELEEISEPALINLKTQQENNAMMLLYYLSSQTSTPRTQTAVFLCVLCMIECSFLCFQVLDHLPMTLFNDLTLENVLCCRSHLKHRIMHCHIVILSSVHNTTIRLISLNQICTGFLLVSQFPTNANEQCWVRYMLINYI